MALKQIKNKIVSTKKTGKVTKAMESVSAVKMRKSQERAFQSRPYVHATLRILQRLADTPESSNHPLAVHYDGPKSMFVLVTSDKGLAGSVNSAVLKKATELFNKGRSNIEIIAIGKKAFEFARREKKVICSSYTNISDGVTLPDVYEIAKTITEHYLTKQYGSVTIIYQNFISTFEQEPTHRQVLPLDPAEIHYILKGIHPQKGKFSELTVSDEHTVSYTVEPSPEEVLNSLFPKLVEIIVYHALLESKASEHSARMVAMKNATDKSKEVARALTLVYNKARQASITAEVAEITGGMEAMK